MALRSRTTTAGRRPRRTASRPLPALFSALVALVLLLGLGACGFNKQTNEPYTPAVGVNGEAGDGLKVRNLVILSREAGSGFLSATMTSAGRDALVGVTGTAFKADGTEGSPLTATLPNPVAVGNGALVVLTDRPLITITSADLKPGLEARVTLQFSSAGEITLRVPVMNANEPEFVTISPTPATTPSS